MNHLVRLAFESWRIVVRPAPAMFLLGSVLGVCLRFLAVLCFVITLQALMVAALPGSGGLLIHIEHWALGGAQSDETIDLALLSAGLVVAAFTLQLAVAFVYQRIVGSLIDSSAEHLVGEKPHATIVDVRRVSSVLATSAVKIAEISVFLLVLGLVIVVFSPLLLTGLAAAGAVALLAFVWFRRGALRSRARLDAAKKSLGKSPAQDDISAFALADEQNRFSKNFAIGIEGFVIGMYVALIVAMFVFSDVSIRSDLTLYSVALVFSLRYAIVYVRELGRAFSGLLDLRAETLLK